jgi:hypothetical protein
MEEIHITLQKIYLGLSLLSFLLQAYQNVDPCGCCARLPPRRRSQ